MCQKIHIFYRYLYQETPEAFLDKVIPAIDHFTDEPVARWDVPVARNTSADDCK